jgi:hypothetical protein
MKAQKEPPRPFVITPCAVCAQVLDGIRQRKGQQMAFDLQRQIMLGCHSCAKLLPKNQGLLTFRTKVFF